MKRHFLENKMIEMTDPTTITVVGIGGTGSALLVELARINYMLKEIGMPGIIVTAIDKNDVKSSNIGRQMFYADDIGFNKASVFITRINESFGFNWKYKASDVSKVKIRSNITVMCLDNVASRESTLKSIDRSYTEWNPSNNPHYLLDTGNDFNKGQVILSTFKTIKQPEVKGDTEGMLPSFIDIYSKKVIDKAKKEDNDIPSCSVWESISQQDPYINRLVATYAARIIWELLKNYNISTHGYFINLEDDIIQPLKV